VAVEHTFLTVFALDRDSQKQAMPRCKSAGARVPEHKGVKL